MATPTLKRSWGYVGMTNNQSDTGRNFKLQLEHAGPSVVTAGDLVLVYVSSLSTDTITISDDQSNTWAVAKTFTTTGLSSAQRTVTIYWAKAAGSMKTITVGVAALTTDIQFGVSVWYNWSGSGTPFDGTAAQQVTPANNTPPNITSGAINTTVDGDLIVNWVVDVVNGNFLGAATISSVAYGTNFTGLYAEVFLGAVAQYTIQGTHGSITPGLTISQTTHDNFVSIAVAIQPGTSGSAPTAGMRIVRSQMFYILATASGNQPVAFPTSGNLIVVGIDFPAPSGSFTLSDNKSNTYTQPAGLPIANFGTIYHADNATAGNDLVFTINIPATGNNYLLGLFDIIGAATSPIDTAATGANSSTLTAAGSGVTQNSGTESSTSVTDAASITPSTSNGLVFDVVAVGNGPWDTLVSPANGSFDYVDATWNVGGGDGNPLLNGDAIAHYHNPNTSAVQFSWTVVNNTSAWQAIAAAFKAGPVSSSVHLLSCIGAGS